MMERTLIETTVRGKRVKVDPVEWIQWEIQNRGHLDRLLHTILEDMRTPRSRNTVNPHV